MTKRKKLFFMVKVVELVWGPKTFWQSSPQSPFLLLQYSMGMPKMTQCFLGRKEEKLLLTFWVGGLFHNKECHNGKIE